MLVIDIEVDIIECDYEFELKRKINEWLKDNGNRELIDIKYSGRGYSVPYGSSHVSAMIIYKKQKRR